jgi:hypothetical protein
MPHELKSLYEKTDQQQRSSRSSQQTFDLVKINAERNYAHSVKNGENKGKQEYNPNTETSVREDGKPIEKTVNLRNDYDKDHPGLRGGGMEASLLAAQTIQELNTRYNNLKRTIDNEYDDVTTKLDSDDTTKRDRIVAKKRSGELKKDEQKLNNAYEKRLKELQKASEKQQRSGGASSSRG